MWTKELPTEPGWYWFYGHKYGDEHKEYGIVKVFEISNGVAHTIDGQFMFMSDGHDGHFAKVEPPSKPLPPPEEGNG